MVSRSLGSRSWRPSRAARRNRSWGDCPGARTGAQHLRRQFAADDALGLGGGRRSSRRGRCRSRRPCPRPCARAPRWRRCRSRRARTDSRRGRRRSRRSRPTPSSSAASTLASPVPRVLWKCRLQRGRRDAPSGTRRPAAHPRRRRHAGRVAERDAVGAVGDGPPGDRDDPLDRHVALVRAAPRGRHDHLHGGAASCATAMSSAISSSDSPVERLTFLRLCVSEAETTTSISVKPASSARSAPRRLGTRAE